MTDEQLKVLAELVLRNDERLSDLSGLLFLLVEKCVDAFDNESPHANALRSLVEQASARERDAEAARQKAREFFGLNP